MKAHDSEEEDEPQLAIPRPGDRIWYRDEEEDGREIIREGTVTPASGWGTVEWVITGDDNTTGETDWCGTETFAYGVLDKTAGIIPRSWAARLPYTISHALRRKRIAVMAWRAARH